MFSLSLSFTLFRSIYLLSIYLSISISISLLRRAGGFWRGVALSPEEAAEVGFHCRFVVEPCSSVIASISSSRSSLIISKLGFTLTHTPPPPPSFLPPSPIFDCTRHASLEEPPTRITPMQHQTEKSKSRKPSRSRRRNNRRRMKSNEKQNKRPTRPSINGDPKTEGRTTQRPVVKKKKKKKSCCFSVVVDFVPVLVLLILILILILILAALAIFTTTTVSFHFQEKPTLHIYIYNFFCFNGWVVDYCDILYLFRIAYDFLFPPSLAFWTGKCSLSVYLSVCSFPSSWIFRGPLRTRLKRKKNNNLRKKKDIFSWVFQTATAKRLLGQFVRVICCSLFSFGCCFFNFFSLSPRLYRCVYNGTLYPFIYIFYIRGSICKHGLGCYI